MLKLQEDYSDNSQNSPSRPHNMPSTFRRQPENRFQKLDQSRRDLQTFGNTLGPLRNLPVNLARFQEDLHAENTALQITFEEVLWHADNSIRKYMIAQYRMKERRNIKTHWNREDLHVLLWLIDKYSHKKFLSAKDYVNERFIQKEADWFEIGRMVPGKDGQQAMFRWLGLKANRCLQKRPWQQWEDSFLRRSVKRKETCRRSNQRQWLNISKDLYYLQDSTDKFYRTQLN